LHEFLEKRGGVNKTTKQSAYVPNKSSGTKGSMFLKAFYEVVEESQRSKNIR